jgi:hypothetical protein
MKQQRSTKCPDCHSATEGIKLVDATAKAAGVHRGAHHVELQYTGGDSKPGILRGGFKPLGTVEAQMCSECGRILLYGEPN